MASFQEPEQERESLEEEEEEVDEDDQEDLDDDDGDFLDHEYWDGFYGDDEEQYDWYSAPGAVFAVVARQVRVVQASGRCADVLDVGCGTAAHLSALASATGAHVTGVDFSKRVVELAAQFDDSKRVSFVRADARFLPFRDAAFDVVVDKGCLDCFVSAQAVDGRSPAACRAAYLREVRRVLRPEGVLVLCAVSDVDVVALLHRGLAVRNVDAIVASTRSPTDEWELARSDAAPHAREDALFRVAQIVANANKHVCRCVPNRAETARDAAQPASVEDDEAPFDDAATGAVGTEDGFFCGACAHRLFANLSAPPPDGEEGLSVPRECPKCANPLRRFAMS